MLSACNSSRRDAVSRPSPSADVRGLSQSRARQGDCHSEERAGRCGEREAVAATPVAVVVEQVREFVREHAADDARRRAVEQLVGDADLGWATRAVVQVGVTGRPVDHTQLQRWRHAWQSPGEGVQEQLRLAATGMLGAAGLVRSAPSAGTHRTSHAPALPCGRRRLAAGRRFVGLLVRARVGGAVGGFADVSDLAC